MVKGQELIELARSTRKQHQKVFHQLRNLPKNDVNELFHTAHEQAFSQINCLDCGNCCKTTPALITSTDARRLSKHLKLSVKEFYSQYTVVDDDHDVVFKSTPCVFLGEDNYCRIYDLRPNACREYPHTNHSNMKQILDITYTNREVCPAVYDIIEMLRTGLNE